MLIIGAGISGIGAGCHLTMKCPDRSFVILENRESIGGTWDLFRYPGIRSDSDMYTFGYSFKPWTNPKEIAPAEDIKEYLDETVQEFGLSEKIRFRHGVQRLDWSSEEKQWTAQVKDQASGEVKTICAQFVINCTGYYNYDKAHQPDLPGMADFDGPLIHPQFWPEDLDYTGKRVVVIGSGATAMTIVPAMAETARHVTMLQRTPSFVVSRPDDPWVAKMRKWLPDKLTWRIKRTKNLILGTVFYNKCKRQPEKIRQFLVGLANRQLDGAYDANEHFNAPYNPWDQRLCLVPQGDLFNALKTDKASVVTDQIDRIEQSSIKLKSGQEIDADIIVSATGISLRFLGGIDAYRDGERIETKDLVNYRGTMFGNVPNFASIFGYANASWTLKADLSADYFCRLINYMKRNDHQAVTPQLQNGSLQVTPMLNLQSGYIKRNEHALPKFGSESPWHNFEYYVIDFLTIRFGRIKNRVLNFQ